MTFEEYIDHCLNTWIQHDRALEEPLLGLIEEVGEVAGKYKKFLRGDYDKAQYDRLVLGELADVLYYLCMYCYEHTIGMTDEICGAKYALKLNNMITTARKDRTCLDIMNLFEKINEIFSIVGYAEDYEDVQKP